MYMRHSILLQHKSLQNKLLLGGYDEKVSCFYFDFFWLNIACIFMQAEHDTFGAGTAKNINSDAKFDADRDSDILDQDNNAHYFAHIDNIADRNHFTDSASGLVLGGSHWRSGFYRKGQPLKRGI